MKFSFTFKINSLHWAIGGAIFQGALFGFAFRSFIGELLDHHIWAGAFTAALMCVNVACIHYAIRSLKSWLDFAVQIRAHQIIKRFTQGAKDHEEEKTAKSTGAKN